LIPDAAPFADLLQAGTLSAADWQAAGRTLRRFHDAGVHHPDLNLRNILRDAGGGIHILDFDKGRLGAGARRQRGELPRLRRSVDKFCVTDTQRQAAAAGWAALLAAYRD